MMGKISKLQRSNMWRLSINAAGIEVNVSLIPAQKAEARVAEICAEHLDTQPDIQPALPGSPTR